jgi:hypothetical protein
MNIEEYLRIQSQRDFFRMIAGGIGTAALGNLFANDDPLAPRAPHFAPKAKNVIFLFQEGAPSQIDLYDPKPGCRSGTVSRCRLR